MIRTTLTHERSAFHARPTRFDLATTPLYNRRLVLPWLLALLLADVARLRIVCRFSSDGHSNFRQMASRVRPNFVQVVVVKLAEVAYGRRPEFEEVDIVERELYPIVVARHRQ